MGVVLVIGTWAGAGECNGRRGSCVESLIGVRGKGEGEGDATGGGGGT